VAAPNLALDFAGTASKGGWVRTSEGIQKHGMRLFFTDGYIDAGNERIVRTSAVFLVTGALG